MNKITTRHRRPTCTVAAIVLVVAGCAGDDEDGFEPGASIPGDSTTTSDTATTATVVTTQPTTTVDDTTPTTSNAPATTTKPTSTAANTTAPTTVAATTTDPEPQLADTPQAPGFDFPPAALQTDPDSPNNRRAVRPEDEPIIAAYFEATLAQIELFTTWPLDPDSGVLDGAPFTENVREAFRSGLAERTSLNQVLDVSGGSTSRPYVVEDDDGDANRVVVWDCQIDATFWKDVDTGEKAPPDSGHPNAGPPGVEIGTATELTLIDGDWLVNGGGYEPRACE